MISFTGSVTIITGFNPQDRFWIDNWEIVELKFNFKISQFQNSPINLSLLYLRSQCKKKDSKESVTGSLLR